MKILSIGIVALTLLLCTHPSQAGVVTAMSPSGATVNVVYNDLNYNANDTHNTTNYINFNTAPGNGNPGNFTGSITTYQANSLSSSATFNYDTTFDNGSGVERFVELYTNSTSRTLSSLTITISNTTGRFSASTFGGKTVDVTNPTGMPQGNPSVAAYPTVTLDTSIASTSLMSGTATSFTLTFLTPLAPNATFGFYILTTGLPAPSANSTSSFLLTETAIPTPEPATLVMGATAIVLSLGARLVRRKRRGSVETA